METRHRKEVGTICATDEPMQQPHPKTNPSNHQIIFFGFSFSLHLYLLEFDPPDWRTGAHVIVSAVVRASRLAKVIIFVRLLTDFGNRCRSFYFLMEEMMEINAAAAAEEEEETHTKRIQILFCVRIGLEAGSLSCRTEGRLQFSFTDQRQQPHGWQPMHFDDVPAAAAPTC